MRVFVTGATGFVGTAVVNELIDAGHSVLGLARSDEGAERLAAVGAEVHRGSLDDLPSLRRGVAHADGVIHTAFNHDFSTYAANCEADRQVIATLGAELQGSDRPLLVTTGMTLLGTGGVGTEEHAPVPSSAGVPRSASEEAAAALAQQGVHACVVRLPQVHDPFKQGLITYLIALAREKGTVAYVDEGANCWPAVHVLDAACLYRLVLEQGQAGARYHAVGEEGVALKAIAESIGRGLNLPVVSVPASGAQQHFGWLARFAGMDSPASSALTQQRLGWRPVETTLIEDLDRAQF
ncbi:nucleoside-diphosphate-sugar epimerase [Acidovorax sp. CF316]|uniref:SDR family oxidoreductase n=1 Tax=Acidovorax sp. CF316 TaxID=1144317 RepID=UPI00026BD489|nr:SDR family oxidoreductase [Acidovorax sp. CF316]EJE48893.1 nucleoside-diphosphate-sugar epimerase [Acidovorax sp. CF316]